jgi:hypothetical protein
MIDIRYSIYLFKAWFKEIKSTARAGLLKLYRTMKFIIVAIQFIVVAAWFGSKLYLHFRNKKSTNSWRRDL